ncbi:MAG: choice-of-anchor M domain-containing protein [Verrucomicrobiales bacterium]|nr:choice-of-anchor M domain-containing protein [Verrucomicrobiales bacterium]
MKTSSFGLAVLLAAAGGGFSAQGQTPIARGHVDLGILYEGGAWDLHVHQEEPEDLEFAPADAVLRIGPKGELAGGVPSTPSATGFFGAAGSPLWILPKTEDPDLPFLGIGAEEMTADDWTGALTLRLEDVRGPGNVFVWDVGAFGELQPKFNSRDGVSASDALSVEAGSHAHYFWAFSSPGDYEVVVSASGQHKVDGAVASEPVAYRFQVVPEPGTGSLALLGALGLAWMHRRRTR